MDLVNVTVNLEQVRAGKLRPMRLHHRNLVLWPIAGDHFVWLRRDQLDEIRAIIEVAMREIDEAAA